MEMSALLEDTRDEAPLSRLRFQRGMLAALDQSGGSTPGALAHYGITTDRLVDEKEMSGLVHQMRVRIMTSPSFDGDRVLGVILFEKTLRGDVYGESVPAFLLKKHSISSFLKIDRGLEPIEAGVQMMKPLAQLAETLEWARSMAVVGTKMRSVIHEAGATEVERVVKQQFFIAEQIFAAGLLPIVETEVSIALPDDVRSRVEQHLHTALESALRSSSGGLRIFLKLTLPVVPGLYTDMMLNPKVYRVFALSGGFSRVEACERLASNPGMIASFSRALLEDLRVGMSNSDFDAELDRTIEEIMEATKAQFRFSKPPDQLSH